MGKRSIFNWRIVLALLLISLLGSVWLMRSSSRWHKTSTGGAVAVTKLILGPYGSTSSTYTPLRYRLLSPLNPTIESLSNLLAHPFDFRLRGRWYIWAGPEQRATFETEVPEGHLWLRLKLRGPQITRYSYCRQVMEDGQMLPEVVYAEHESSSFDGYEQTDVIQVTLPYARDQIPPSASCLNPTTATKEFRLKFQIHVSRMLFAKGGHSRCLKVLEQMISKSSFDQLPRKTRQ